LPSSPMTATLASDVDYGGRGQVDAHLGCLPVPGMHTRQNEWAGPLGPQGQRERAMLLRQQHRDGEPPVKAVYAKVIRLVHCEDQIRHGLARVVHTHVDVDRLEHGRMRRGHGDGACDRQRR